MLRKSAVSLLSASIIAASVLSASAFAAIESKIVSNKNLYELTTYAGIGDQGASDNVLLKATFGIPNSVILLKDGRMVVSDTNNQLIRLLDASNASTLAGVNIDKDAYGNPLGYYHDGPSAESFFNQPTGLAVNSQGSIIIADRGNHAIRMMDSKGQVTTLAGNGVMGNKDGKGKGASFNEPQDVVVASDDTIYVADTLNHTVRKITAGGTVTTLNAYSTRVIQVADGLAEAAGDYQDGLLKEAKFNEPTGLALDSKGNLYVSDSGNQRIRYIDFGTGTVSTVAGGSHASSSSIYAPSELYAEGDYADGLGSDARFDHPTGITVTPEGGLLITDTLNHAIRYLYNGQVTTLIGNKEAVGGKADGVAASGLLQNPTDVVLSADGSIYIADSYNNKLRKLSKYTLPTSIVKDRTTKVVYGQKAFTFDVLPESVQSRTMIPVRVITEQLGYKVKYKSNGTIELSKESTTIQLTLGKLETVTTIGDQSHAGKLEIAPYSKSGRTFVPIRFFAESIGLDVQWDAEYKTVILRDKFKTKN